MATKIIRRGRRDGVTKRGDHWYGSWTNAAGERTRQRLEAATYNDAVEEANKRRAEARRLRVTGLSAPSTAKLATFISAFIAYQKKRQTTESLRRTEGILARAEVAHLLAMPVNTIHSTHIHALAETLSDVKVIKRGEPTQEKYTINVRGEIRHRERTIRPKVESSISAGAVFKEFGVWKKLFNWLATVAKEIPTNPAANIAPPVKKPRARKEFIESRDDFQRILDECPAWLRPIVEFAAHTGMRRGEILGMTWGMVDLAERQVTLTETKNGEERPVSLNRSALAVIQSIRPSAKVKLKDFVFHPGESKDARQGGDNVSKAFKAVVVRLGYSDLSLHSLRRTTASWMRMAGVDFLTVAEGLGHKDMRTARVYQRAVSSHLREAYDRLDEQIGRKAVQPEAGPVEQMLGSR